MRSALPRRAVSAVRRFGAGLIDHFRQQDPTFWVALGPALVVAALLFVRSPYTNYIFDEQEALLANPYVNGKELGFFQVLERDFWGLPSDRSIGSYRPLPDVLWRLLWQAHPRLRHPWVHHSMNVIIHAINAALLCAIARRIGLSRPRAWLAGTVFLTSAVLTEAVAGVVGIADVLGGLGVLLAVRALSLPMLAMVPAVFIALTVGFFSKESTLVALPIVPWVALVWAPLLHPRPRRLARALLALAASVAALVFYTEVRRKFFPVVVPPPAPDEASHTWVVRLFHEFLRWFAQPKLPADPINNPLVDAGALERAAGGLRVYLEGLSQVVFPWTLSGDYSFAAEPVPERLVTPASVLGAALLALPPVAAVVLALVAWWRQRRAAGSTVTLAVVAVALFWVPIAYFPHSNIPMPLPTVRAERFWYLPVVGSSLAFALALDAIARYRLRGGLRVGLFFVLAFLGFQAGRARGHAMDYSNDLAFWRATARAVPASAKAHLNYGVMLGARGRLPERLVENGEALRIAPQWPMAHIYYADTLCRLHRVKEAWPEYVKGFEMAPNDRNLIALAIQCLWDEKGVADHRAELLDLSQEHRGTWLAYLARDVVHNGEKHKGVDPKYRPRGYDEGPKKN